MQITLKKDGFYYRKKKVKDLLPYWGTNLEIESDVLLGDFFSILQTLDLVSISKLTNSNIAPFLKDWDPAKQEKSELHAIEVYRVIEVNNFDEIDMPEVTIYTSAHGLGELWKDLPENASEEQLRNCNSYALEFTDWHELSGLRLSLKPKVWFTEVTWKACELRPSCFDEAGDPLFETDRDIVSTEQREFKTEYTLGEFLEGLFNELCFFGSPDEREKENKLIQDRIDEIDKDIN